jgi:hypothetical protein
MKKKKPSQGKHCPDRRPVQEFMAPWGRGLI